MAWSESGPCVELSFYDCICNCLVHFQLMFGPAGVIVRGGTERLIDTHKYTSERQVGLYLLGIEVNCS